MTRCHLLLCLWATLLWSIAEGQPLSVERLPDGTDLMLSSMGLVEGVEQRHELDQAPGPGWQQSAGSPLIRLSNNYDTEDVGNEDGTILRQPPRTLLLSPVSSLQPPRQRRSGTSTTSGTSGGTSGLSDAQHKQLTRQLLRRYKELQKRSRPYRSSLFRQARGYMCLSKVCNFKGARGK